MLIESDEMEEPAKKEEEIFLEPKEVKKEKEPELSLHAMEGSSSPRIIRLLGQVQKTSQ